MCEQAQITLLHKAIIKSVYTSALECVMGQQCRNMRRRYYATLL